MEPRINLSSNEKIAREVSGLESGATHFVINGEEADKTLRRDAEIKFNTKVDEYVDKINKQTEATLKNSEKIAEAIDTLEIMPIYNYILIKPFENNPFQKITVTKSGLITDLGGMKPTFKNQDNGQVEEEENLIHVGVVVEVGKECKFIKEGDTVMWPKTSEVPVPFFKQGFVLVNENRIIVTINEGLKKRFENE